MALPCLSRSLVSTPKSSLQAAGAASVGGSRMGGKTAAIRQHYSFDAVFESLSRAVVAYWGHSHGGNLPGSAPPAAV